MADYGTEDQPAERHDSIDEEEAEEESMDDLVSAEASQRRDENIRAMVGDRLELSRKALLPGVLSVGAAEVVLRKPFKSPHPNAPSCSQTLQRKLLCRRRFVPWGGSPLPPISSPLRPLPVLPSEPEKKANLQVELPPDIEPLVLWEPPEGDALPPIEVDSMLTRWLRPHQREGVQFMFECVAGLRTYAGNGLILADDMGLGKTLQGIALLWTMLQCGHPSLGGTPMAKRVIICCPTSLVSNWDSECEKWLQGRVKTLALCESTREEALTSMQQFLSPRNPYQVLIVSYETFRIHADKFKAEGSCDLLICDEAHRLKNDQTLTNKALAGLACTRRVLLSGTPLQNHLDEFYAMVNFCNPGILGTPAEFRRRFEAPILQGREPNSTADEAQLGEERSSELSAIVNEFILRRTNSLLSAHLPPKVIEIVCCKLTELQTGLYTHFLASNAARSLLAGKKSARVLSAITSLKKLCNHPKLIYDTMQDKSNDGVADGFEGCNSFFLPGVFDDGRVGRGGMASGWEMLSGKFAVLATMLDKLRRVTTDRIVIVSNYTQTLDLIAHLCKSRMYPCLRLDGSTPLAKRQKLVKQFNDLEQAQFVFLLSSKAGGCGLNLVGGNRLVLFDPDWNPANDKQAAGRVWRDGQKKRVYVYRFLSAGTIEEKVFQRQLSKEGLQAVVNKAEDAKGAANLMSSEELRDLFTLRSSTVSDTFDSMCSGSSGSESEGDEKPQMLAPATNSLVKKQVGAPAEEDLKNWGQHSGPGTVPDEIMQRVGEELPGTVSFVFTCQVAGKAIEEEPGKPHVSPSGSPALPAASAPAKMRSDPASTSAPAAHRPRRPSRLKVEGKPPEVERVVGDKLAPSSTPQPLVPLHRSIPAGACSMPQVGFRRRFGKPTDLQSNPSPAELQVKPETDGSIQSASRPGPCTAPLPPKSGKKRTPESEPGKRTSKRTPPSSAPALKGNTVQVPATGRKPLQPHNTSLKSLALQKSPATAQQGAVPVAISDSDEE